MRRDELDPLDVIYAQRRITRRMILYALLSSILVGGWWRADRSILGSLPLVRSVLGVDSLPAVITAPPPSTLPHLSTQTAAGAPPKMNPRDLERTLRNAPASKRPPSHVHCGPGQNGWDYVCTYQTGSSKPAGPFKIGVRVSADAIVLASAPRHLLSALPAPQAGSAP